MKNIEELKKEQAETKSKLVELVEFVNSEEYYTLTPSEKNIIGQRRIALEMYLNSLTKGIYDKDNSTLDLGSAMWPILMTSMFTGPSSFSPSSKADDLKKLLDEKDFEVKEEKDEQ